MVWNKSTYLDLNINFHTKWSTNIWIQKSANFYSIWIVRGFAIFQLPNHSRKTHTTIFITLSASTKPFFFFFFCQENTTYYQVQSTFCSDIGHPEYILLLHSSVLWYPLHIILGHLIIPMIPGLLIISEKGDHELPGDFLSFDKFNLAQGGSNRS